MQPRSQHLKQALMESFYRENTPNAIGKSSAAGKAIRMQGKFKIVHDIIIYDIYTLIY